ncbi:ABC transporter permease [Clostridium brassicae]|uniref:Proline/glycine betaine ABC transporter permease n=1 Tax=Clostridium brassicae TaxID=2999072 RepID=A0ABT4D761_9CLOT|nr:proline/glycine betaine ABC transporter permease [Clostridium brassicae]MCY6958109.1 proline/glycine betaine ABC transporter permease [Clostridium brassicae]
MHYFNLPLEEWTNSFVDGWLIPTLGGFFNKISYGIGWFIDLITTLFTAFPPELIAIIIIIIAWKFAGKSVAIFTVIGLLYLGSVDIWKEAMQTLSIVFVATIFSIVVGVPIGILSAKHRTFDHIIRPILDFMQTLPSFVYLIPAILLFGLGGVPAVIATFIFATPPAVRMTNLGIKQVPADVVEAAHAFGATSKQLLLKVQLPLAIPTIMAGINQTIMLALSMAVIASMIGAPGLGSLVLAGISSVNVGKGLVGGLGIVVLAIILDRVTQGLGKSKRNIS